MSAPSIDTNHRKKWLCLALRKNGTMRHRHSWRDGYIHLVRCRWCGKSKKEILKP